MSSVQNSGMSSLFNAVGTVSAGATRAAAPTTRENVLRSENGQLRAENGRLEAENQSLESRRQALEGENRSLESNVARLEAQVDQAQGTAATNGAQAPSESAGPVQRFARIENPTDQGSLLNVYA